MPHKIYTGPLLIYSQKELNLDSTSSEMLKQEEQYHKVLVLFWTMADKHIINHFKPAVTA